MMNTISLCRPAPELSKAIKRDILVAQMHVLETHFRSLNPYFEQDEHMAIMNKLAETYYQVNRYVTSGKKNVAKLDE